ncbi:MAG: peptidoglycan-binding protein [Lachnospiraceae bacterium]|nr:peptidoglycan-binding protein [Lachnospiraceae bacterium]
MHFNIKKIVCVISAVAIIAAAVFGFFPVKSYATTYYAAFYSVKTCQHGDDSTTVGNNVYFVQDFLDRYGYYSGYLDGDFGYYTRAAVYSYQSAKGLTYDGIVGFYTWRELLKDGELSTSFSCRTVGRGYGLCLNESKPVTTRCFYFKIDSTDNNYTTVYF